MEIDMTVVTIDKETHVTNASSEMDLWVKRNGMNQVEIHSNEFIHDSIEFEFAHQIKPPYRHPKNRWGNKFANKLYLE